MIEQNELYVQCSESLTSSLGYATVFPSVVRITRELRLDDVVSLTTVVSGYLFERERALITQHVWRYHRIADNTTSSEYGSLGQVW